jgi:hypothetical protein
MGWQQLKFSFSWLKPYTCKWKFWDILLNFYTAAIQNFLKELVPIYMIFHFSKGVLVQKPINWSQKSFKVAPKTLKFRFS